MKSFPFPLITFINVLFLLSLSIFSNFIPQSICSSPLPPLPSLPPFISPPSSILVLGSGGLIGSTLTRHLRSLNFTVLEVRNRQHIDLRVPFSLLTHFPPAEYNISFAFFLACEVGGSKFIDNQSGNIQLEIVNNNILIYQNVLSYLHNQNIPFLFSSSYLQDSPSAYGSIKRLGEVWIKSYNNNNFISLPPSYISALYPSSLPPLSPFGKVVRLWNVYGAEKYNALKSHVITDWITQCLQNNDTNNNNTPNDIDSDTSVSIGQIHSLTNGYEPRQFIHVEDVVRAFAFHMKHFPFMSTVTDLSSKQWVTLRELSAVVSDSIFKVESGSRRCGVMWSEREGKVKDIIHPDGESEFWRISQMEGERGEKGWEAKISLGEGMEGLVRHYKKELEELRRKDNDANDHSTKTEL